MHSKILIIGSGPAGYTAAIYAARSNLKHILVSGFQPGGQLTITTDVENYPGYEDPIQGPWLMEQMQKQAAHVGTEIINSQVTEVFLNEKNLKLSSPLDAKKNKIGMVFQHFNLFETLSVFENLSIDATEDNKSLRVRINEIFKKYNFSIDLDVPVLNLSAGQKQKVEIIRCLLRSPKVLIMDEPTSVLTEQETEELFISLKKFNSESFYHSEINFRKQSNLPPFYKFISIITKSTLISFTVRIYMDDIRITFG